eukprot:1583676-Pyramimonas_sp.AAC.1
MDYRKSSDLTHEQAESVFASLPPAALQQPTSFYKNSKFKNAPTWADAKKLIPCLSKLLDYTSGAN